jgi:ubiquinone/menaquinone biosynthesis C-methylase UbiE
MAHADAAFTDSIPEVYERLLVPLLFAPYAADIVERARAIGGRRVLEIAAGTGIVTRLLTELLPDAEIEATDLNEAMVARASQHVSSSAVRWSTADAMALPFEDGRFDLVVCQFGMMFFPDRPRAFREARRVLASGGAYLFNVWDSLEYNEVARIISEAAGAAFPDDPPLFLKRTPYGHADPAAIERDLREAGFDDIAYESVAKRSTAATHDAATGICEGSPLRSEILARDAQRLPEVIRQVTRALQTAFGGDAVDGEMRAYVITAR